MIGYIIGCWFVTAYLALCFYMNGQEHKASNTILREYARELTDEKRKLRIEVSDLRRFKNRFLSLVESAKKRRNRK